MFLAALFGLALSGLALAGAPAQAQPGGAPTAAQHLRTEPLVIFTSHGPVKFTVEIADNDREREVGLMFRKSMGPLEGMLFNFRTVQPVAFWMRNTLIPLDMLFITADGHVLSIAHDAIPMNETPIPSGGPILGVLEIAGGRAAALDIQPGDRVQERIFAHGG
jgi:uncharacterized membrane protein (UPF0127 family)